MKSISGILLGGFDLENNEVIKIPVKSTIEIVIPRYDIYATDIYGNRELVAYCDSMEKANKFCNALCEEHFMNTMKISI